MSERPTVLLVDDHAVVRAGIRMLLESQADVTVVPEASSAEDAIASDGRVAPREHPGKLGVRSRADLVRVAAEIEESESRTGKEEGPSHARPP